LSFKEVGVSFSWGLLYVLSEWAIRLVMLVYVPQKRSADAARAWLVLIFLVPWVGLVLYALIGRIRYPRERLVSEAFAIKRIRGVQEEMASLSAFRPPPLGNQEQRTASLVQRLGDFAPLGGNRVELLPDYQPAIDRLVVDIEAAKHHVHLLFYIFAPDATGRKVADALERAARRGVSCRVVMDALGSAGGLRHLAPELRKAGVEVVAAMPVHYLRRRKGARADLRNHRKLAVIDGDIGYVGSQNIVDPSFLPAYPNEELLVRVVGPVVVQLQALFLADRFQETESRLETKALLPSNASAGDSPAQVLPSGPGYAYENQQTMLVDLLHEARKRVVMTTPYFVPDEPFLEAMVTAALRGAEVRLVVPEGIDGDEISRIAEGMTLAAKLGMDPKVFAAIVNTSSGRCWSSDTYNPYPGVLENVPASRSYSGGFGSDLMLKDLTLATDAAKNAKLPVMLGALAQQIYQKHSVDGNGAKDFSSVILQYMKT